MSNLNHIKFITVEGIDGCGKSTIVQIIADYFKELKIDYILTREPYDQMREQILNENMDFLNSKQIALMFAQNRIEHLYELVIPKLKEDIYVICDRYVDSSVAYQAFGEQLGVDYIKEINKYAFTHLPHTTIYLDVDIPIAKQRIKNNRQLGDQNRFDKADNEFFKLVKEGYQYCIDNDYDNRIQVINANLDLQEVKQQVINLLNQRVLNEN